MREARLDLEELPVRLVDLGESIRFLQESNPLQDGRDQLREALELPQQIVVAEARHFGHRKTGLPARKPEATG